jgi:hypothetical protein
MGTRKDATPSPTLPQMQADIEHRPHLGEGEYTGNLGVLGRKAAENTQISGFNASWFYCYWQKEPIQNIDP